MEKGYILVISVGGITGLVQVNDIHLHKKLKKVYRKLESAKPLAKPEEDHTKIPSPTRSEMINFLTQANAAFRLDRKSVFTSV